MWELAWPWALALLPVPLMVWFFLPRAALHISSALNVPFYRAIAGIIDANRYHVSSRTSLGWFLLIWCLLIGALSGPRWVGEPRLITHEGYNMMLALDLSGSMELTDMLMHGRPVSRLSIVKKTAEQFVKERVGDKIGLILFGSRAYLQTPLTYDHQNLITRIEDASVGLAGKTTSIGDALGLAVKRLQNVPKTGRVIILLTDGANNSGVLTPLRAADLAHEDDIKVYTIGLGSDASQSMHGFFNLSINPSADLDEKTLKAVAEATGGQYFRATDAQSLQAIYQTINRLEKSTQEQETIRPQQEYYPWPLALALLLLVYWLSQESRLFTAMLYSLRRTHE